MKAPIAASLPKDYPPLSNQCARCPESGTTGHINALFPRPVSLLVDHLAHLVQIPPNSRTGVPVQRAESVIAVRQSPYSALGAHGGASCMPIGGADVRLFGEKRMLAGAIDRLSFGTAFAAWLVATILVIR